VTGIIEDATEIHQLARNLVNGTWSEIVMLFSAENRFKIILEVGNDQLILEAVYIILYI
jgi:hypothetical protein